MIKLRRKIAVERNEVWLMDIMFDQFMGEDGFMKKFSCICFMDEASDYVVHAELCPIFSQTILEDRLRQAIEKHGAPEELTFDRGMIGKRIESACLKLGINLIYGTPNRRTERFFRQAKNAFLDCAKKKPLSLNDLSKMFDAWLELYRSVPRAPKSRSPVDVYQSESHPIRFLDAQTIARAFSNSL